MLDLKNAENTTSKVSEPEVEYAIKVDFDERFAKGIPHHEMRRRTFEFIENLPWKEHQK